MPKKRQVTVLAIQILIGGQDYTQYTDIKSIKIDSNIAVTSDTASFDAYIPKKAVPRPKGGQEIKIMNGSSIEFGGVIMEPKEIAVASDQMKYSISCRDYVYWLNKRVVTNTYNNYTSGNIVKDIVSNFTSGFTANNVYGTDSSFAISQIKFDHKAPSECIKKLADDIGFQWWVDYNKDVHFGPVMTTLSPLPNNTLLVDTDTTNYGDLEFDEDVSQLRNQIYYMGYKIPADYTITETFTTDGQSTSYNTTYEPIHYLTKITVTLNGSTVAKSLDIAGGLPNNQLQDGKVYIYYKNKSFRWNVAPTSGQTLTITYYPMFEMVSMFNDPNAMAVMKSRDGQDGVYEYGTRDQQLSSIDTTLVNIRSQLDLMKYAYPHYTGSFTSFTQGWVPGQYFYCTSNNRMDGEFQNQIFYVIKVSKEIVHHPTNGTPTLKYTINFSDTPYSY